MPSTDDVNPAPVHRLVGRLSVKQKIFLQSLAIIDVDILSWFECSINEYRTAYSLVRRGLCEFEGSIDIQEDWFHCRLTDLGREWLSPNAKITGPGEPAQGEQK